MRGTGPDTPAAPEVVVPGLSDASASASLRRGRKAGSRTLAGQAGAVLPHARFGNLLTAALLYRLYGVQVTDLGPMRAVRRDLLLTLDMQEMIYGWPTEMMVKAARARARIVEVEVSYRPRVAGQSKVSGTLTGSVRAGFQILRTTLRYALT